MPVNLKEEFDNYISEDYKSAVLSAAFAAEKYDIPIYLIGGIVRDLILKKPVKDIDIAVEYDALKFCDMLKTEVPCEIISVQENLRTVKVRFKNGAEVDFASTREERYIKSGSLPEAFNFGCSLKSDVKRRDFTINTLAVSLEGDNKFFLIDYFNGYDDIKNKKIKILHDKSFIDDPSRIIRALKFKERLNFELDSKTAFLMEEYLKNTDKTIPLERIKNELRQYFSIPKENLYKTIIDYNAYKLISENPVIDYKPELFSYLKLHNLYKEDDIWFVYIAMLIVNSEYINERLNLNSFEKTVLKEVKELLCTHNIDIDNNIEIYNTYCDKTDLSLAVYFVITGDKTVQKFLEALKQIKVLITGKDLINLGFIPSAYFSELFEKVLKEKLKGNLSTKEEELNFVKWFIPKTE